AADPRGSGLLRHAGDLDRGRDGRSAFREAGFVQPPRERNGRHGDRGPAGADRAMLPRPPKRKSQSADREKARGALGEGAPGERAMTMQRGVLSAAAALSLAFNALSTLSPATAQTMAPIMAPNWPSRTVRFIVSIGPGSGSDITARLLAERLSSRWGQPVVVENRPAGDAVIAI